MAKPVIAVILAGGEGERLSILSSVRAKPAVPFGGKYRIIDFTLSNAVNSGIYNVVVLTQYNPRSLNDHIGLGRPWDLDRNNGGVRMLQPYIKRGRIAEWYGGTADAVLQNFNVVERGGDTILVLAGVPTNEAVLGTLLYRLFSFWLPIPIGALAWAGWRLHPETRVSAG